MRHAMELESRAHPQAYCDAKPGKELAAMAH
jgi:hypothetical protein